MWQGATHTAFEGGAANLGALSGDTVGIPHWSSFHLFICSTVFTYKSLAMHSHCDKPFASYLITFAKCTALIFPLLMPVFFFIPVFLKLHLKIPRCLLMQIPGPRSLEFWSCWPWWGLGVCIFWKEDSKGCWCQQCSECSLGHSDHWAAQAVFTYLALLTPVFLPIITTAVSGAVFLWFGIVAKNTVPGMCRALTMYVIHTSSLGLIL